MVLDRILTTLDSLSAGPAGAQADGAAVRVCFLEWLWSLPAGCDLANQAQKAERHIAESGPQTRAKLVLREMLRQAACPLPPARRRGGAAGKRLH